MDFIPNILKQQQRKAANTILTMSFHGLLNPWYRPSIWYSSNSAYAVKASIVITHHREAGGITQKLLDQQL
jgi:hypothetical protein